MSQNVEREEVQAILEAMDDGLEASRPVEVQPRNFRQPRRLSRQRLQYLAQLVNATLQGVCHDVASPLRQHHKISLASISEVNVLGLFEGYEPPFVVDIFECGGHVSWILWDSAAAAASVETILSGPPPVEPEPSEDTESEDEEGEADPAPSTPPEPVARRLSASECRVIEALLQKILVPVAKALGLETSGSRLAQEPEELTTLEDCGPDADPRRLMLHFLFEGPGAPSDIRIYLPDVGEEDPVSETEEEHDEVTLPEHLEQVSLGLSAYLGSVDVPLSELMELEVGDVIPLGVEIDSPVDIYIEDRCCARAAWGTHHGLQAIRVLELNTHPGTIEQPEEEL